MTLDGERSFIDRKLLPRHDTAIRYCAGLPHTSAGFATPPPNVAQGRWIIAVSAENAPWSPAIPDPGQEPRSDGLGSTRHRPGTAARAARPNTSAVAQKCGFNPLDPTRTATPAAHMTRIAPAPLRKPAATTRPRCRRSKANSNYLRRVNGRTSARLRTNGTRRRQRRNRHDFERNTTSQR